jgi:hypothetical protein
MALNVGFAGTSQAGELKREFHSHCDDLLGEACAGWNHGERFVSRRSVIPESHAPGEVIERQRCPFLSQKF